MPDRRRIAEAWERAHREQWGISHTAALALSLLYQERVPRPALRVVIARLHPGGNPDTHRTARRRALAEFARRGWIVRDGPGHVRVLDREALRRYATARTGDPRRSAEVREAVRQVRREMRGHRRRAAARAGSTPGITPLKSLRSCAGVST